MLESPFPSQLPPSSWGHPQNGVALLPRGGSSASPRKQGQPQGPGKRKILLLLGNEGGDAQPKQGEQYRAIWGREGITTNVKPA